MRVIDFNGYIESMQWYDDDITPEMLRRELYGEAGGNADDVTLRMNCYGGDTNAATRMHDMLKEYPGQVTVRISGTAASAATVVACGADRVEMSPGSLYMIHDPMTFTFGNIADHKDSLKLLSTVKDSILNMYEARNGLGRERLSVMMTASTWMDAKEALEKGFADGIYAGGTSDTAVPRAHVAETLDSAKQKVAAYAERVKARMHGERLVLDFDKQANAPGKLMQADPITADSLPAGIFGEDILAESINAKSLTADVLHDWEISAAKLLAGAVDPAGGNAPAAKTGDDARGDVPAGTSAELLRKRLRLYE